MKFNENIYKYLSNYFDKIVEEDEILGKAMNEYFLPLNKLYDDGKISLNEVDELSDTQCDFISFVIRVVSSCPDLFIIFTDEEKLKNLV